ncbi:MAG TPA: SEC-C domain-containing protein [Herpetosiphonaceae bacterium]
MAAIGRNDPCPCGSGKKYKHCHEPIDREQADHARRLRRAQDQLFEKMISKAQDEETMPLVPAAMELFWQGQYQLADLTELDDKEDRGADRFLTWLVFDYLGESGTTLGERIAANLLESDEELDELERELLPTWINSRLRPYVVEEIIKGKGAQIRDMITGEEHRLRDHAAAQRLKQGEVVVTHLVPVAGEYFIAGAAAQLTPDAQEQMAEFLAIQLETWRLQNPDADLEGFVRAHSHLFNHFIMALPREERVSTMDDLLLRGKVGLNLARQSLGLGGADDDEQDEDDQDGEDDEDAGADEIDADIDADADAEDDAAGAEPIEPAGADTAGADETGGGDARASEERPAAGDELSITGETA